MAVRVRATRASEVNCIDSTKFGGQEEFAWVGAEPFVDVKAERRKENGPQL
jgi:hypothetical protein